MPRGGGSWGRGATGREGRAGRRARKVLTPRREGQAPGEAARRGNFCAHRGRRRPAAGECFVLFSTLCLWVLQHPAESQTAGAEAWVMAGQGAAGDRAVPGPQCWYPARKVCPTWASVPMNGGNSRPTPRHRTLRLPRRCSVLNLFNFRTACETGGQTESRFRGEL